MSGLSVKISVTYQIGNFLQSQHGHPSGINAMRRITVQHTEPR